MTSGLMRRAAPFEAFNRGFLITSQGCGTARVSAMGRLRPERVESGDIQSPGRCPPFLNMANPRNSAATLAATDATM